MCIFVHVFTTLGKHFLSLQEGQLTIEDSDDVVRKVSQQNKRLKLESAVPLCIEIGKYFQLASLKGFLV